ncbi:uncharacterized protein LOC143221846 [Lasioglossum baleicum]|uniref:uncharacterized protein LOC143221846 n=1 Tax=Lasioglossum baleicum TaxID=434251 RepID=UPI003FCD8DE9
MQPRIAVIIVGLALVSVVRSDTNLKCYMCTTSTNPHCASDPKAHGIQLVECTLKLMSEWRDTLQHNKNVSAVVAKIFDVDHPTDFNHVAPMTCAKVVLKVNKKEVTLRNCQIAKTETLDPCKSIQRQVNSNSSSSLEHCELCTHDACNTSPGLSSRIFVTLLSFVGAVILGGFYNGA